VNGRSRFRDWSKWAPLLSRRDANASRRWNKGGARATYPVVIGRIDVPEHQSADLLNKTLPNTSFTARWWKKTIECTRFDRIKCRHLARKNPIGLVSKFGSISVFSCPKGHVIKLAAVRRTSSMSSFIRCCWTSRIATSRSWKDGLIRPSSVSKYPGTIDRIARGYRSTRRSF